MAALSHVFFKNELDGVVTYKQKTRYGKKNEEEEIEKQEEPDYHLKQQAFQNSLINFKIDRQTRIDQRNLGLKIREHIFYIKIKFHNTFDSSVFSNKYQQNFGLIPVSYAELNTVVLFAVNNQIRFQEFERQINLFINNDNPAENINYNTDIKFIVEYTLLSSEKIINFQNLKPHVIINLIDDSQLYQSLILPIEKNLVNYLDERKVEFYCDFQIGTVELINANDDLIKEIADNFDIIHSINSMSAGVIRPNRFNLPEITFGFTITNANDDLPIIGIIDSGISNQNPLSELIVNDNNFDLTATSVVIDNIDHGTAVAAFAALGRKLIPNHIGNFEADAKLLPIKVLDQGNAHIPTLEIVRLIRDAYEKYNVQIFTLTVCFLEHKKYNDPISEYAYALDKLSYELNILIFISVANIHPEKLSDFQTGQIVTYPQHFEEEYSNLCAPAESMNNLTVGAVADNLEGNTLTRISPTGTVPAIYSRTFHINWSHHSTSRTKINKMLFKPDICNYGGDFCALLNPSVNGIKVLSATPGRFFEREVGTSYAAPLTANLAARLLKLYPSLGENMQTVKALIINAAQCDPRPDLFNLPFTKQTHVLGNGIPDMEVCQYSSSDRITFILEDKITPGEIKSYPVKLPEYLLDLKRKTGLVSIEATLCFKFNPTKNNQIGYCPVQISFGIFRNLPLEAYELNENGSKKLEDDKPISLGINNNSTDNFKFSKSWSQDYYYKAKMLSNTHKINFSISKAVLIDENCSFKIALHSKLHKLINISDADANNIPHSFSLVITAMEGKVKNKNTGRLYAEMLEVNNLESIAILDNLEGELDA